MRTKAILLLLCLSLCTITACDGRRIQDMVFIFAIGVDYKEGKYELYGQVMNFSTLVGGDKTPPPQDTNNVWIGHSSDPIFENALYKLRSTSDKMTTSHLAALIFGPNILKGKQSVLDQFFRSPTTRLTPWIFGSEEPLDKLLTAVPFLTNSTYYSLYGQPEERFRQDSFIPPIRTYRLANQINEPSNVAIVPRIKTAKKTWQNEKKPLPQLEVDGAYVISKQQPTSDFSLYELRGLRWLTDETIATPVYLTLGNQQSISLTAVRPKVKIRSTIKHGHAHHDINLKINAHVVQTDQTLPEDQLKTKLEKKISNDVMTTYQLGVKKNLDILRLRYHFYHHDPQLWRQIQAKPLNDDTIAIHTNFEVTNTGFLKEEKLK